MKKTLVLLLFAVLAAGTVPVSAQSESTPSNGRAPLRKNYINFSLVTQHSYTPDGISDWTDSAIGTAFTYGHSYILHKKPIAGMVHIGLDATWVDFNYARDTSDHIDIGLGVGPAIHLTPVSKLGIHSWFRFNPSCSILVTDEYDKHSDSNKSYTGFAPMFTAGTAVSWGVISLGVEARFGRAEYSSDDYPDYKLNTSGFRTYFGLRF